MRSLFAPYEAWGLYGGAAVPVHVTDRLNVSLALGAPRPVIAAAYMDLVPIWVPMGLLRAGFALLVDEILWASHEFGHGAAPLAAIEQIDVKLIPAGYRPLPMAWIVLHTPSTLDPKRSLPIYGRSGAPLEEMAAAVAEAFGRQRDAGCRKARSR